MLLNGCAVSRRARGTSKRWIRELFNYPEEAVIYPTGACKLLGECPGLPMTLLTLFGLFAVTTMLIFYAFENKSHWCVLGFAGSCVLSSIYGFLQGAWPFGLVEGIWSVVALQRWMTVKK